MITVPGFNPGADGVWEIGSEGFKQAEKSSFASNIPGKKSITRYVSASTNVLLVEKKDTIEITVGRLVSDETIKNVMGYAMKQNKFLEICRCESLDNLRIVDRMVVLCNEFVQNAQPRLADIPIEDLNNEEDVYE